MSGVADHTMHLGGASTEFLELRFGRVFEEDPEPYRGVELTLDFSFGAFSGGCGAVVFAPELHRLRRELELLSRTLNGRFQFATLEDQFGFSLAMEATGQALFSGHILDQAGVGNRLEFETRIDQTYLARALEGLSAFIEDRL